MQCSQYTTIAHFFELTTKLLESEEQTVRSGFNAFTMKTKPLLLR
jgi:hypothetical protein